MEAQNLIGNSRVNITAGGKTHLGAVIGSKEYRDEYVKDLVKNWDNQLTILSTIAETQLQAAYLSFASGFKSKLNCFLRTIQTPPLTATSRKNNLKEVYPSCNRMPHMQ